MQHVIEVDQVREIDYLSGDDAYKQDWMSHRRERWGILAFNLRTFKGVLAACKHIGGRRLKSIFNANSLAKASNSSRKPSNADPKMSKH